MKRYLATCLFVLLSMSAFSLSAQVASTDSDDFARGSADFKAGRYRSAFRLLKPFAEAGNPDAQLNLGQMYASGRLAELDGAEAAHWFREAAAQGKPEAQYSLGQLYLSGWGVPANGKTALAWLWKAGRQGYLKAQLLLGRLLSEGKRVPQDRGAARLWYAQAASQGSVEAAEKLEAMGGVAGSTGDAELSDGSEALLAPTLVESTDGERSREQMLARRLSELRTMRRKEREGVGAAGVMDDSTEPQADYEGAGADSGETLALDEGEDESEEGAREAASKETGSKEAGATEELIAEEGIEALVLDDGEGVEELVLEEFDSATPQEETEIEIGVDTSPGIGSDDPVSAADSDEFTLVDDEPAREEPVVPDTDDAGVATSAEATPEAELVVATPAPATKEVAAVTEPVAAPAPKQTHEPAIKPEPAATPEPEQAAEKAPVDALGLYGREWLLARNPNHYTIQLLGSRTRSEAERFVKKNSLAEVAAIVESRRRGKPWFSLFYGDYRNYSHAKSGLKTLSKGLARHGPWIRKYRKIQKSLGGKP